MQSQPFTAYQTYYTSLVNQYASIQNCLKVCPSANPYYDQNNKICINCPNGSPLFDLETFRCANCGTGFIFDPSNHQCILNNSWFIYLIWYLKIFYQFIHSYSMIGS
jgi:hypothetical protein